MRKMRKMRNYTQLIFVARKMRKFAPTRKPVELKTPNTKGQYLFFITFIFLSLIIYHHIQYVGIYIYIIQVIYLFNCLYLIIYMCEVLPPVPLN